MELTLTNLENCFKEAIRRDANFIGVAVEMQGFLRPEIIINERANFESKLEYYKKAYNQDLTLKTFSGIKIIGFACGNYFDEVQDKLGL